ncbi:mitochondrial 37S ribosomal protein uS9m [Aspergillus undulatus]|uniref:mitochondrial 37S ribosomal protein uS9m n=1 Tax=Aspergillus undulatus TaxID=1810928 RepID=UPI003CCCDDDC
MGWKNPTGVAHAMQSVRSATYLRASLSQRSAAPPHLAPRTILSTRTQLHGIQRGYATEAHPAAPEIDFRSLENRPARIIPASPSYFTGTPKFFDHLLKLESILAKYASLPTVAAGDAPRMAWLKLPAFREFVGETVPTKKYKGLLKVLQRLNRIDPSISPQEVRLTLEQFLRPGNPYGLQIASPTVDELGRARGKGTRKSSSAVVYLVEGDGEVLINEKSLVEAFPRVHDRESATWALRSSNRLDKYNVWAKVNGGGTTGQAEAVALALGRALMVHEPALKPILRRAGVITVDARRVERKKPGHVKARKSPTWVKR